ncbi:hypothetical protein [Legionella birminghamensis]|nr:hypothetical protein [Legionella birminghamensis]
MQKKKALGLNLIAKLQLTSHPEISLLLATMQADKDKSLTVPLADFIRWLWTEVKDKPDFIVPFAQALYEIQRGYNLNKQGIDMGGNDKPICYGGTANKFCEKLSSLSPLIQFLYVNKKTITKKLKQLTEEATFGFIKELRNQAITGSEAERERFKQVIAQLTDDERVSILLKDVFTKSAIASAVNNEFSGRCREEDLVKCVEDFQAALPYLQFADQKELNTLVRPLPDKIQASASRLNTFFQSSTNSTDNDPIQFGSSNSQTFLLEDEELPKQSHRP